MTDEMSPPKSTGGLSWSEIWTQALTRPSVMTFENLINQPQATRQRAYKWVFLSTLVGGTVATMAEWLRGQSPHWLQWAGIPILALLAVIALILAAGVTQWVARAIGGTGNSTQLVYAFATFNAPMSVATGFVFGTILLLPLSLYGLILTVIAVKAVHRFSWGKAVVSVLPILLGTLLIPITAIAILVSNLRG